MSTPKMHLVVAVVLALVAFGACWPLHADSKPANPDEELLREAKVGTDGPGLLAFFRERTPADEDLLHPERLVQQLASPSFEKREEASRTLIRLERLALPLARRAMADDDAEVAKRAKACVNEIKQRLLRSVPVAAVRLLRDRHPDGAVEALLGYLPLAPDEETEEEIWYAIEALTAEGKAHPTLLTALKDPLPARRALAACLVAGRGEEQEQLGARKLLDDPEPLVRLRAAQGFLSARKKCALPTLIGLLEEPDVAVSWQAEELLHYVAGAAAPPETVGAATVPARTMCRAAWEAWWKKTGDRVDLGILDETPRRPSLVFVCGASREGDDRGRVCLFGCRGPARWQLRYGWQPLDVQLLPGNTVLVGEEKEGLGSQIVERNLAGEELREQIVPDANRGRGVGSFRRLANGDTFIFSGHDWLVVNPEGKMVLPLPDPTRDGRAGWLSDAKWLGNGFVLAVVNPFTGSGDVLCIHAETDKIARKVKESDKTGGWELQPLPGGHFLLDGDDKDGPCVRETNARGRTVSRTSIPALGHWHARRNGNVLVASGGAHEGGLVPEVDRTGTTVWVAVLDSGATRVRTCLHLVSFGLDAPRPKRVALDSVDGQLRLLAENDPSLRRQGCLGLEALRTKAPRVIRALIHGLDDADDGVRAAATEALATIGNAAVPALAEALATSNPRMEIGSARAIRLLSTHAHPPVAVLRQSMRFDGAQLLETPHLERVVAGLRQMVEAREVSVRKEALATLRCLGRGAEAAVPDLLTALRDEDREVRYGAAAALGRIGPAARRSVPALLEALAGKDEHLQAVAADTLGVLKVPEKEVIAPLAGSLSEKAAFNTRCAAARALGQFGPAAKAAVAPLIDLIQTIQRRKGEGTEEGQRLCTVAAWALGEMAEGGKDAVPVLVELVRQDSPSRRPSLLAAVEALGKFGPASRELALPALGEVLAAAHTARDAYLEQLVEAASAKVMGEK
jgi:HEAT repeat protein